MYYIVKPTNGLQGDVKIPGSKSGTARGILLGTMAEGVSRIYNPMPGIDSYSIIDCCKALGAEIDCNSDDEWIIKGVGVKNLKAPAAVLDVGNSGTGYYLLTTLASIIEGLTVITGDYQICYRPIAPLLKAIREMGGKAISTRDNELAPLAIEGKIQGGHTVNFPGVNVQWLIGLLVCCPSLEKDTVLRVDNLGERPYAELTIDWLKAAGVTVINNNFEEFIIPGGQTYQPFTKMAPSDWCGATYPIVATAITEGSKIKLLNMDVNDFQGERVFVDIIRDMGGSVQVLNGGKDGIIIEGRKPLTGIEIDCKNMPDAIPALAVLGSYAQGKTVLKNIEACRLKETDRCKSIVEELTKMGGKFEETHGSLTIHHSKLHGATLSGHHDHRIVMASTCAALAAEGETLIDSAETVGVSFPRFYEEMSGIGANITRLIEE
ncbi:3-phosphoshikimate 1-carboxyvinyltransferase [Marasmitruncus massiliensis]|uniref:3-phosphoshikimate 1-carboxyvinyltransferase n=1 Tax=Marasmitruncus massiliensis TaxID=1944642 RepID=UPI000C7C9182|nr:3-phosphoshikimate 1-carboxyvinyltransferase [Marasmitruncus massiliensis]